MDFNKVLRTANLPPRKPITKLGTVKIGVVETTPVVWQGELVFFEWIRNHGWGRVDGVTQEVGFYQFSRWDTREPICPPFALNHCFGCCYEENGVMTVVGVEGEGGGQVLNRFTSTDLIHWEKENVYTFTKDYQLYNTSLCKGPEGYIIALEVLNPAVGRAFTTVYFRSQDQKKWELLPVEEYVYRKDRYSACPSIRYYDGYYYIIYLESAPFHRWLPYIVRSRDLKEYDPGVTNPIFFPSDEDKKLYPGAVFTPEQTHYIENAVNCNNSDVDLCEFEGKTYITYSWGNQYGKEFLAFASYDGTEREFLASFFPKDE